MYSPSLKFIIQILLVSLHLAYTQYGVDSYTLYFASAQEKLHILLFHLVHSILSLPVRLSIKRLNNVRDAQASFINFSIPNGLLSLAASSKWCKLTDSEGQYYTIVTRKQTLHSLARQTLDYNGPHAVHVLAY